ncbi:MAG TPA: 30S ribosomal protein S7 [Methanomassiliicoccales archaeon]
MNSLAEETTLQFNNILLFGKFAMADVVVKDGGLAKYINLSPISLPHSDARHANRWFGKSKVNIVERLLNNMMRTEVYTGKKMKAYRVTKDAFDVIAERTKKNPVQVLVEALENAAPREEITRLQFGGISVPKAVDIAPSRRLDIALRNISKGAIQASFKTTKPIELCLADELILAAKNDMNSFSVAKKEEVERVAQSAR